MIDKYIQTITLIGGRYFLVAGISFLLFYFLLKWIVENKKIQSKYPKASDYIREIGFSTLTIFIFGVVPLVFIHNQNISKYTTLFKNVDDYGWFYFWSVFPIMLFMHDTYFYWMHRIMHHKKLFNLFHLVHHQSTNPSPWAAYSFHPLEAIIEAGILVVFLFTIPIHLIHFVSFFMFMILYNVYFAKIHKREHKCSQSFRELVQRFLTYLCFYFEYLREKNLFFKILWRFIHGIFQTFFVKNDFI